MRALIRVTILEGDGSEQLPLAVQRGSHKDGGAEINSVGDVFQIEYETGEDVLTLLVGPMHASEA